MAIVWTKDWGPSDDGTIIKGIDLKNLQDDINTTGLADADKIQGFPVDAPTAADDGKALIYDHANAKFIYGSLSGIPAGMYVPYGGTTAPAGWLLCYGQAVDRTTYADLFTAISTGFGVGDGATTFNVPDIRGRTPLGKDNMGGVSANRVTDAAADSIGGTLGSEEHTLTTAEMPAHTHDYEEGVLTGSLDGSTAPYNNGLTTKATTSTGGGTAHNNLPPSQTGNYIIKT